MSSIKPCQSIDPVNLSPFCSAVNKLLNRH
jgi:hypothetical protein